MTGLPSEVDVAVIGAGAAGIGAARRLCQAGTVSVLALEARDRVGGRVNTIAPAGFPLDRGAEWLHSADRNPLSQIAKHLGFLVHGRPPEWTTRLRRSGETVEAEADWIATREAQSRTRRKAAVEPVDRSLASLLVPGERWNELLDATSTWGNGAELDRVSVKDHVRRLGFLCSLQPGKSRQNVVAGALDEFASEAWAQRVDDAGFPVDQGAIAIEGEDVEVGQAHGGVSKVG